MPEGPEVKIISHTIEKSIGTQFHSISILRKPWFKHRYVRNGIPSIKNFQNGFKISNVKVKGKLIRINLKTSSDNQFSVLNTLGMSGTWSLGDRDHQHSRIAFDAVSGLDLIFKDQRCFGTFNITSIVEADERFQKIGWDLLQSPMPVVDWLNLKNNRFIKNKPIGEVLMSQKYFSGIGNIYKSEILFKCRVNPSILLSNLSNNKWKEINKTAHEILQEAYQNNGSTVQSYQANGKKGKFQNKLLIYKKEECPNRHEVESIMQKKRVTWWCPACQQ